VVFRKFKKNSEKEKQCRYRFIVPSTNKLNKTKKEKRKELTSLKVIQIILKKKKKKNLIFKILNTYHNLKAT